MKNDVYILGISGGFLNGNQDASASLIKNNKIISAVAEERLIRIKHARGTFPKKSIQYCLDVGDIEIDDVDYLAFHMNTSLELIGAIEEYMMFHFGYSPKIILVNHHLCHAAMYYVSGFEESKILTFDYSGDSISTTLNYGKDNKITKIKDYKKPNSLGIFYAIITQFLGFNMDSDEYKVMGLASYGEKDDSLIKCMDEILKVEDNSYQLNNDIVNTSGSWSRSRQQQRYTDLLIDILGENRKSNQPITQREKNIAYAAQRQFEKACVSLLKDLSDRFDSKNLCLSGGSALNCTMNSVLSDTEYVDNIFVSPVVSDVGVSLGSALVVANDLGFIFDKLETPFLGPEYLNSEIRGYLDIAGFEYKYMDKNFLLDYISDRILDGDIIGWFQGRMEFGERALGNRSILADPSNIDMKNKLNKKIKFRESFRPFAPSVILDDAKEYFEDIVETPYMTMTYKVKTNTLPAITHVDGTARVQTVRRSNNELYYDLLLSIKEKIGKGIVLNTSLNVMGQPIVCSPKDALSVFGSSGLDVIVLGNYVVEK